MDSAGRPGIHQQAAGAATDAQRVGRLLGKNSRAAGAFEVKIDPDADGFAKCQ
jgi:hypothetical protein